MTSNARETKKYVNWGMHTSKYFKELSLRSFSIHSAPVRSIYTHPLKHLSILAGVLVDCSMYSRISILYVTLQLLVTIVIIFTCC